MPEFLFEHPWLLLAAVPALALVVWVLRGTSTPLPGLRRAIGGAGLAAAACALLLCAAGLFWQVPSEHRTVWVLVDRSLSVGKGGERKLSTVLQDLSNSLPHDDYVGVILFDENAEILLKPIPAHDLRPEYELPVWEPHDETYIGPALELASQHTVAGTSPFAILLSDGYDSTSRYGGDVVREVRDSRVKLFTLAVDSDPLPETAVADFGARLVGSDEQVLAIDLVVFSTVEQFVVPQVKLNGEPAANIECDKLDARGRLRVGVGRNPVRMRLRPTERLPAYVVEVSIAAEQNTYTRNDSLKLSVRGPGASRILLLHGEDSAEPALERALRRGGLHVTTGGPELLPSEIVELSKYQVLVLANVPATALSGAQQSMIERFVRNGGGLAMIGGPRSYAPGGYYETTVEKVLPVTCDVVEKGRKQIPALVVALDKSGSMSAQVGNYTKMDLANEGCARSIRLVPLSSYFGMLAVDTKGDWVVPLAPLKDKDAAVNLARGNQVGGGGIDVDVAIREAVAALRATKAITKHVVIFGDGADVDRQEGMLELVEKVHLEEMITFSTICLGRGKDEGFLRSLAQLGGGRYFLVTDANDLPAVFSREAALSAGNFIREEEFRPWHGLPGSLTEGVDFEKAPAPPLLGYVAATARPEAHVWLWADEDKERPLLATWNIELGKSLAFTSDARDRWADRWLAWDSFDELWLRWIKHLLPEPERIEGVESEWSVNRIGPVLTLSFFDEAGNPRALDNPIAELTNADGSSSPGAVLPVGSGSYRVQFSRSGSGGYAATVRERPEGGEERPAAREHQIFVPLDELMARPADEAGLRAMAESSGGRLIGGPREILDASAEGGFRVVWPFSGLLWTAVTGLFLGIGARRFPSVWRRRAVEQRRRKEEADRALTASAAFERVRKQLAERNKPVVPVRSSHYATPPAINPPPPKPQPAREKAGPSAGAADGDSLLSAMRKVRKQLEDRREEP
ncbi:MAG: VWA domain-containing protein [Planctomycetes bacterium]|nr:VWA domain-containing protein [Planctomycetota bacterium]MCB9934575.1 VWA domain-containing protein [Planctomycetota bacterium]